MGDEIHAWLDFAADEIKNGNHLLAAMQYQLNHYERPPGLSTDRSISPPVPRMSEGSFEIACLAHSGRPVKFEDFEYPVYHDLASLQVKKGGVPVHFRHQEEVPIGYVANIRMRAYYGDMVATARIWRESCATLGARIREAAKKWETNEDPRPLDLIQA
jgi:hypothetical protein